MSIHHIQLDMGFEKEYDSKEEAMFAMYVSELMDAGWIDKYEYHPDSFELSDKVVSHVMLEAKNHNKIKEVKLLNEHKYTADWIIWWNKKAHGVMYWLEMGVYKKGFYPYSKTCPDAYVPFKAVIDGYGNAFSIVDVKGEVVGKNNSSAITFPINQKMLYSKLGLFVQKVVVSLTDKSIFARTFTPRLVIANEVYKKDCKYGKAGDSKLKYTPILLEQWTKKRTG